ncbi:MAG: trigger factor [Gammaproteobacteria bacterium]|nr:trigger factor [Gammaproteobacteria bacterium]MCP5196178.1 trigger factor [Gammaproteobacteria bacterium]
MQVSVEALNDLERRVTVQVPAEKVANEIQDRLQTLSRQVKMAGFRPGKVPLKMVKRLHGDQVQYEVVSELMEHSLREALIQEKLNPLSQPKIEPKPLEEGQDFEYSVTFEVMPEFEATGFETVQVERPTAEVTEQDIDQMVESLRWQRADWSLVERPANLNDRLQLDLHGTIDGQPLANDQGKDITLILGRKATFPELEEKLIGLSSGAEAEFDLTFPQDYPAGGVAGKTAHIQVKLHRVEEATLPDVDDAFAEGFDVREGGVAGLRQSLRDNMERELREGIKAMVKKQVMQGLLEANQIPLPKILVEQEINYLAHQMMNIPSNTEDNDKIKHIKHQLFGAEARRRLTLSLLISDLATRHHIELDEQRVRAYLESVAAAYEEPDEWIRSCEQDAQALNNIRGLVFEDQIIEWVLDRAQLTEKKSTFSEVTAPLQQPAILTDPGLVGAETVPSPQPPVSLTDQESSL